MGIDAGLEVETERGLLEFSREGRGKAAFPQLLAFKLFSKSSQQGNQFSLVTTIFPLESLQEMESLLRTVESLGIEFLAT